MAVNSGTPGSAGDAVEVWEKRPEETANAYAGFVHYRDSGPTRSLYRTADELSKPRATVLDWSQKYGWVSRADAWDRYMSREAAQAQIDAVIEMNKRHARIAQGMQGKIVERLRTLDPNKLTPSQLISWFNIATEVERKALGADVQRVEVTGKDGSPIEVAELTPEEKRERLKEIQAEIARRLRQQGQEPEEQP